MPTTPGLPAIRPAAGVVVGAVLVIEDANPEFVTGRNEGHVRREPVVDDTGEVSAMAPAAIASVPQSTFFRGAKGVRGAKEVTNRIARWCA